MMEKRLITQCENEQKVGPSQREESNGQEIYKMVLNLVNNYGNENLKSQQDSHGSSARLAIILKFYNTKNWQGCGAAGTSLQC